MKLTLETVMKLISLLLTMYISLVTSFKGFPSNGLHKLLAKRGDAGDWRVTFKGKAFEEITFATRHEDIVLECEAGGSPTPTIHWLKDGERIQQGISRDFQDDTASYEEKVNPQHQPMLRLGKVKSKLYLDCVTDRDEAEYTCVAESPYERITQSTVLKMDNSISALSRENCLSKKAFRGEPARIHLWTAVRVEFQGAAVQLFCRAEGYPKPACTWKDSEYGETIKDDNSHKLLPNGDLLISEISWANMGDYHCKCENEAGVDAVATFLYPTLP